MSMRESVRADRSLHLVEVAAGGSLTGAVNEPHLAVLGRARPVATHGKATSLTSDPETGRMHIEADAQAKDRKTLSFFSKLGEAGHFCKEISQVRVPGHATGASYD